MRNFVRYICMSYMSFEPNMTLYKFSSNQCLGMCIEVSDVSKAVTRVLLRKVLISREFYAMIENVYVAKGANARYFLDCAAGDRIFCLYTPTHRICIFNEFFDVKRLRDDI